MVPRSLATGIVGAVFALACSSSVPPSSPAEPITLTIGVPQARQGDPTHSINTLASGLSRQRLTASDATGLATPLLVKSWSVSDDGLEWHLPLRSDVRFHDGSPMTAEDVRRSMERAMSTSGPTQTACLGDVSGVSLPGNDEVVVRLARRCSILLDDLDFAITKGSEKDEVGTGPFVLESDITVATDIINLSANDHYFLGRPAIDRVVFRAHDTLREAWAEMLRGQEDFLWEVSPEAAEFLGEQSSVELRSHLNYYVYTIILNSARKPLDRREVRQALSLAIDREALLNQAFRGQGVAGASPIWPRHWALPTNRPALPYDPREAAVRLRKALGLAPKAPTDDRKPILTFTCLLPEGFTVYERLALLVQQQLRAVDVEMRLEALPPDTFNGERILPGKFDAVLIPVLGGPSLSVPYRLWHSPSPSAHRWNFWGYRSGTVDAALDAMRGAPDTAAIRRAVAQLDQALREDPPGLVLVWSQATQAISRRFTVPKSGDGRDALHVLGAWTPSGSGAGVR